MVKFVDIPYVRPDMDAVLDSVKAAIQGIKTANNAGVVKNNFGDTSAVFGDGNGDTVLSHGKQVNFLTVKGTEQGFGNTHLKTSVEREGIYPSRTEL